MYFVAGDGPTCGQHIALHPDVDKVAFTGSSAVGKRILSASAESNLKRITLELGGKSPLIIYDDCDMDQAIDVSMVGLFANGGQCCVASSRIFVQVRNKFCIHIGANLTHHVRSFRTQSTMSSSSASLRRLGHASWAIRSRRMSSRDQWCVRDCGHATTSYCLSAFSVAGGQGTVRQGDELHQHRQE